MGAPLSGEAAKMRVKAARTSGKGARKIKTLLLPSQSPRGFSARDRLYYFARPTKTTMLRRLQLSCKPLLFSLLACNSKIDFFREVRGKILYAVWNFGLNGWLIDAQGLLTIYKKFLGNSV